MERIVGIGFSQWALFNLVATLESRKGVADARQDVTPLLLTSSHA